MFDWISIKNGKKKKKVLIKFFFNTNFKGNLLKALWINILWQLIAIIENLLRVAPFFLILILILNPLIQMNKFKYLPKPLLFFF